MTNFDTIQPDMLTQDPHEVAPTLGLSFGWRCLHGSSSVDPRTYPDVVGRLDQLVTEQVRSDPTPLTWQPLPKKPHLQETYHNFTANLGGSDDHDILVRVLRLTPEAPEEATEPLIYSVGGLALMATWPTGFTDIGRVKARERHTDTPSCKNDLSRVAAIVTYLGCVLGGATPYDASLRRITPVHTPAGIAQVLLPIAVANAVRAEVFCSRKVYELEDIMDFIEPERYRQLSAR